MNPYILAARKAVESQYDGVCDIIEYQEKQDPIKKITRHEEITVQEKQPCRLSFEEVYVNNETNTESKVVTKVKLFIAPELQINPGSKIIVKQRGRKKAYKNSGEPAVYNTHQEFMLEIFKGWA